MRIVSYWDLDDTEPIECAECSWRGRAADCGRELFEALMELECPKCSCRLMRVDFPTAAETQEAAQQGLPGSAAEALRRVRGEARTSQVLRDPSVLPDLDGDELCFEWDIEHSSGEATTIVRHERNEICREPAFWEGDTRFQAMFDLLRRRYGDRFASLTPAPSSELWLDGDQLGSRRARAERLDAYRRERNTRRSFVAGYLGRDDTAFIGQRASTWPDPDAFRAGWELHDAERLVQSADSPRELERDEHDLQVILARVRDEYGTSVIEAAQSAKRDRTIPPADNIESDNERDGRFYLIQDPGDAEPYALVMIRSGAYWWWTREGWVDTPAFASYFAGGEPGARPIDPVDLDHWKATIRKPDPGAVAMLRGRP